MPVALYDHPAFREHDAGPGHPERPERLDALRRGIAEAGLEPRLELIEPPLASREALERVHSAAHVGRIEASAGSIVRFDADTQAGPRSWEAAQRAAGAVVDAVDRVLRGDYDRALCAVRPPGHHAEADRAMGFCLLDNVAVGAAHALAQGLERVMIVDWDVHHGNGTQGIFDAEPRVLYVSSHAYPFYPGTGALTEVGRGPGEGFTVNLPVPQGAGDGEYERLYREIVLPVGRAYDPELLLVSVGFDPYVGDPLAGMRVTEAGFAALTEACLAIEGAGTEAPLPSVFVLEGGYDLEGISRSTGAVVRSLLGETSVAPRAETAAGFVRLIETYRQELSGYWPCLAG